MKRDLDLIRRILLAVEEADDYTLQCKDLTDDEFDEQTIARHVKLLRESRLIDASLLDSPYVGGAQSGTIDRLTWAGHEFLDAARNNSVWARARRTVNEKLGGASFEVMKALLVSYTRTQLGLSGGPEPP